MCICKLNQHKTECNNASAITHLSGCTANGGPPENSPTGNISVMSSLQHELMMQQVMCET